MINGVAIMMASFSSPEFLIFLSLGVSVALSTEQFEHVITKYGKLRGKVKTVLDKELVLYHGVRYANPPVGVLRFKPPVNPDKWTGTVDALSLSRACPQPPDGTFPGFWGSEMWNPNTLQDEDCLFLNMWVPRGVKNATVMVWIFGGGFYSGSPSLDVYNGEGLAAEGNVIVVNVNYRVGAFGFLFLDHKDVPGNVGLLDQQLALKWIQANIHFFGGDPRKVTLFGESAGAASVMAHMIAPSSRGLFHNGILQSGAVQNPWAMEYPSRGLEKSQALAKRVGCSKGSKADIISCLLELPTQSLVGELWSHEEIKYFMEFPLAIVSKDDNFFKDMDAYYAIRNGYFEPVDVIMGVNADEGTFWLTYYLPKLFGKDTKGIINRHDYHITVNTSLNREKPLFRHAASYQYSEKHNNTFVGPVNQRNSYSNAINQLVGDYQFTCDSVWFGQELIKKGSKVYFYYFDYRISSNPWPAWMGAMHGYEIEFIFGIPLVNKTHGQGNYTHSEMKLSKEFINYWVSFASNGKPVLKSSTQDNDQWVPLTDPTKHPYLLLQPGPKRIQYNIKKDNCDFWSEIRFIHYRLSMCPFI